MEGVEVEVSLGSVNLYRRGGVVLGGDYGGGWLKLRRGFLKI